MDCCATYLIDVYHLSEYLAAASEVIASENNAAWLKQKQEMMKENRVSEVWTPEGDSGEVKDQRSVVDDRERGEDVGVAGGESKWRMESILGEGASSRSLI